MTLVVSLARFPVVLTSCFPDLLKLDSTQGQEGGLPPLLIEAESTKKISQRLIEA
jgi:hypothetical protein